MSDERIAGRDGSRVDDTVTVTRAQLGRWACKVEGASELAGEIAGGTARDALHELATEIALMVVRRDDNVGATARASAPPTGPE